VASGLNVIWFHEILSREFLVSFFNNKEFAKFGYAQRHCGSAYSCKNLKGEALGITFLL